MSARVPTKGSPDVIELRMQRRNDGGLRLWSPDIPGLALSHSNVALLLDDLPAVLKTMLAEWLA